jgi:hypothetical protein
VKAPPKKKKKKDRTQNFWRNGADGCRLTTWIVCTNYFLYPAIGASPFWQARLH